MRISRLVSIALFGLLSTSTLALEVKPRTTASIECSKQADQKGLHGKARKKFRSACIRTSRKRL
jgi:psiF repeat